MVAMLPAADRCGFDPAAQAVRRKFGIAGRVLLDEARNPTPIVQWR
jgi:hypothetical protein